jgi:translation elongation factor P/translation initiation factor 5A
MAALIEAIDIKRKMYFEFEGAPYHCLDVEVSKPTARGGQTLVRVKMRNLLTRAVFDKTFKAGEKFAEPDLSTSEASFLYTDASGFHFMDQESYETLTLNADLVGDDRAFLTDNRRIHRAGRARRHGERRRHQGRHARDRARNPRAALHQGGREGEGPHRNARVRRPGVAMSAPLSRREVLQQIGAAGVVDLPRGTLRGRRPTRETLL